MSSTPGRRLRDVRHNRDLPQLPWRAVTEPYLTPLIQDIPDGPFTHNAHAAETARAISGWWNDQTRIPPADLGFHPGFVRNTTHRKETRERLVLNIRDSIAALERCCGVGCLLVVFQGEQDPALAQKLPSSLTLDERNVRLIYSEIFQVNSPVFSPAIGDIRDVCLRQLGIAYLQDFRTRTYKSYYFANVQLEPEMVTKSLILQRSPPPCDPEIQALPTVDEESGPLKASLRATPRFDSPGPTMSRRPATPERSHRVMSLAYDMTPESRLSGIDTVHSQLSSMHLSDTYPSTSTPLRPSQASRPVTLPSEVYDLLTALGENNTTFARVDHVYQHIPRSSQEVALIALGFNPGTSKALAFLLR